MRIENEPERQIVSQSDILIVGASYTGLAAALALRHMLGDDVVISVADQSAPIIAAASDPRCFALSAGSRLLLEALKVWPDVDRHAQDVSQITVTDTPLDAAVRPVLLRYDNHLESGAVASSIVPGAVLLNALWNAVQRHPSIQFVDKATVVEIDSGDAGRAGVVLADGRQLSASLLIAADGRQSTVRRLAGIKTTDCNHLQTGIVATVRHSKPHQGCATQHFLPAGPFAILPLVGDRSCLTWTEDTDIAATIMAMDDDDFLDEVRRRMAGRLGEVSLEGTRSSFPLTTHLARQFIGPRLALVGDAAHGVHPIAGQGLNLAMRDVAALAERVSEARRVGLELGDRTTLEAYEGWRRFDSTLSTGVFVGLNRLFSKEGALLRSMRGAGLGLVDHLPDLKRRLVEEAAGLAGDVPGLMREKAS